MSFALGGADGMNDIMIESLNIGGMLHTHMPGTYYFISAY